MKIFHVFLFSVFSTLIAFPQDIVRLVSTEICNCIDNPANLSDLETKLDSCLNVSLENVISLLDEDQQEMMADGEAIDRTVSDVSEKLIFYCPKIKDFVLAEKKKIYYRMSDSEKANEYYNIGVKAYESKEYRKAEKSFLKAIKEDRGWVYPYDDLGLNYREAGKYKKAVKYYSRSLAIYPEGPYALQNQAVAYTYLKESEKALRNYTLLAFLYPDNPEGFFGAARVYFMTGNYEDALEYAFYSYKMYFANQSEYLKDAEKLISMIHEKLRDMNKLDIFMDIAKKFGFPADEN